MQLFLFSCFALLLSGKASAQSQCNAQFVYNTQQGSTYFYDTSYTSSGTITNYQWSFGDGTSGTGNNPVHQYNGTGTYTVCLTIVTSTGCSDTTCNVITVGNPCGLTASAIYDSTQMVVSVYPAGGTAPYTYSWTNGATTQVIGNVTPGTYCCVVTDANLCIYTTCITVPGSQPCNANYTHTQSSNTVTFSNLSTGYSSLLWNFGDGVTSTSTNPIHVYTQAGIYGPCLTLFLNGSQCSIKCDTIVIGNPCNLVANAYYDSLNNVVSVVATGGTPPYSYSWNNGTTTQTISNPLPGQYCCAVIDSNGCAFTTCVVVPGAGSCNASFVHTQSGNMVAFSNSSTGYTSLQWNFGDGQSSTSPSPVHTYTSSGMYYACLYLYSNGALCSSQCDTILITSQGNSFVCGNVFNDLNANGVNNNEPGFGGGYVYIWGNGAQTTAYVDSFGHYSANIPAGSYYISYCVQQPYSLTLPPDSGGCGMYQVTIGANDSICGFDFGVANNSVIIEGYVFIDANNNGVKDAGEAGIPYQSVQVGTSWGYTNSTGKYTVYVPAGTYTATYAPTGMYAGYPLSTPGNISITATTVGNTYGGNNFGLNIPAGSVNLGIQILPHTTITPGFPAWYDLQVCNYGVVPTGADVIMNYDGGLTLDYSYPTETSNNTTTHTLTWTLSPIAPGSCVNIRVDFDASTGYVIGASTFEEASVNPTSGIDINMSNNTDTVHQIVTGSWDPNNKLSVQTNFNDPNYQVISSVNSNQQIQYTINFQNLGTAPAVNVVVVDALASNVDASSFQMSGASHNVNVSRNGNVVTYSFAGIMLPDATANEPQSHGFVSYIVNSVNGLAAGTQISDFSNIYFDFNAPVTTNNAVVTMVNPTGISEVNADAAMLNAYPNPVSNQATLQFYVGTTSNVSIDLMDAAGRSVSVVNNKAFDKGVQQVEFNASNYANGVYVLKLNVNGKTSFTKISVSH